MLLSLNILPVNTVVELNECLDHDINNVLWLFHIVLVSCQWALLVLTSPSDFLLQVQLEGGRQQYKPVVMALTEKDILLFESVPWSRESWSIPLLTHPLLATR